MKKWFGKLNIYFKCSILSAIFLLLGALSLPIFNIFHLLEIPLGYILGSGFGIVIYFVNGLLEEKNNQTYKWAVVFITLRYFLFALFLILLGLCYYYWEIRIFNLISFVGGYVTCIIISIIIYLLEGRKERINSGRS